jgi:hypothetical protein
MDAAIAIACKVTKKANQKTNAMKLFDQQDNEYIVTIKNVMRFELTMDHISIDMLFRWMAAAIQHAKDRTKTTKLTSMNNLIVGQFTHVLVVVALQQIADMVDHESVWAMSLAGDGNTHRDQSCFNMRLCVYYHDNLLNLHLVAMAMFEGHTTLNIFNMISKFMDALYSKWHVKLIDMSTNGENTMTGRHTGVMTNIVTCAEHKVLQIWCASHQINIVVKASTESINGGSWVKFAYRFSVYLHMQDILIINTNVKCPKKTNHWVHLGRLFAFYK